MNINKICEDNSLSRCGMAAVQPTTLRRPNMVAGKDAYRGYRGKAGERPTW